MAWLSALAILVTAILAWMNHKSVSAKRSTLGFIYASEITNKLLRDARLHFGELAGGDGQKLLELAGKTPDDLESAASVALFLNHCELVAIAILSGAMDEKMYKDWRCATYVRNWREAEAFVTAKRKNLDQPKLYENFQNLAEKWK